MSEPSEKPHKKTSSHFVAVFSETWKETELRDVILMDVLGTAMTLFLAVTNHIVAWDEIKELSFLAFVGGVCGVIISFTYRFFFVTPVKMIRGLELQLEDAQLKLNERLIVKPLIVEALPPQKKSVHTHFIYECEISVLNENQVASGVKLKLLTIEPSFRSVYRTSDQFDLDEIKFSLNGSAESKLNEGEKTTVGIFIVERDVSGITLEFAVEWEHQESEKRFVPQQENGEIVEHVLTFEVSAIGIAARQTKFKMAFSRDPKNPPFILEKINLVELERSAGNSGVEIQGTPKKYRDPAIVVILICLCASLATLLIFQTAKLRRQIASIPKPAVAIHIDTSERKKSESPSAQSVVAVAPQEKDVPAPQFQPLDTGHDEIDTNSANATLAKTLADLDAEKNAEKITQEKKDSEAAMLSWAKCLPYYDRTIEKFSDLMVIEASNRQDQVLTLSPSPSFIRCIPQDIDIHIEDTNVAEIRFQKNTNWDFHIVVLKRDQNNRRTLKIYCAGGALNVDAFPDSNIFATSLYGPTGLIYNPNVPIEQARAVTQRSLLLLMGLQDKYLNKTNN